MNVGGPAFQRPSSEAVDTQGQHFFPEAQSGMTLRDYFAAAALTGLLAAESYPDGPSRTFTEAAAVAYTQADAMLAQREQSE